MRHQVLSITAALALAAIPAFMAGCNEVATDDEASEDELIVFPAAAYSSAVPIAYGESKSQAFTAAKRFVAVKFEGAAGDRIRFVVTGTRATRAYLVTNQRSVQTLTDPSDAPGAFRYTLKAAGTYYIMMRSANRADDTLNVGLEKIASPGASSNLSITAKEIADSSEAAKVPEHEIIAKTRISVPMSVRTCVLATGCGPLRPNAGLELADISLSGSASVDGKVALKLTHCFAGFCETRSTTDGNVPAISREVTVSGQTYQVQMSLTRGQVMVSARSTPAPGEQSWEELSGQGVMAIAPKLAPKPRFAAIADGTYALVADRTPLDDEEVLSRFAPGTMSLTVLTAGLPRRGTAATARDYLHIRNTIGRSQLCAQTTGCSDPSEGAQFGTASVAGYFHANATLMVGVVGVTLRTTGADSYKVRIETSANTVIEIPIEGGYGTLQTSNGPMRVVVTAEGLLIEGKATFQKTTTARKYNDGAFVDQVTYARSNDTSLLIGFNQGWP